MRITLIATALLIGCPSISHADIAPWQLMESDFFRWSNWRENLSLYDCTNKMWYYMGNAPPQIVEPPPYVPPYSPPVYVPPVGYEPPPYTPPWTPTPPLPPMNGVPEPATWVMFLCGFAAMGWFGWRRA